MRYAVAFTGEGHDTIKITFVEADTVRAAANSVLGYDDESELPESLDKLQSYLFEAGCAIDVQPIPDTIVRALS